MSIGGGDSGEEGRGMERAGIKEVRGLSARFQGVSTEGQNVGGEAGLKERGFVGRDSGGNNLRRSGHRGINPGRVLRL